MPPPRMPDFYQLIQEMIRSSQVRPFLSSINLGGTSGPNGGGGRPPGGTVGQLAQSLVTYDTTEAYTYVGEATLVDNLNHMRAEAYELSWWS